MQFDHKLDKNIFWSVVGRVSIRYECFFKWKLNSLLHHIVDYHSWVIHHIIVLKGPSPRGSVQHSKSVTYGQGKADYDVLFPNSIAWDLNQDPNHRAKKCGDTLTTLTTGCNHLWLRDNHRYMRGVELMALHSIPISSQIAKAMRCSKVVTSAVSNTAQCFLAGNSMHGASVGTVVAVGLLCTKISESES